MTASFDDGKDDGALRTIGEVSKALDIKTHVLRYWEQQFPQLEPLKRSGGRRYYRTEDIALIETIDRLVNHEGYTIKGAQKALAAHEVEVGEMPEEASSEAIESEAPKVVSSVPFATAEMPEDGGVDAFFGGENAADAPAEAESTAATAEAPSEPAPAATEAAQADAAAVEATTAEPSAAELVSAINAEVLQRLKAMRGALAEALEA